jgi:hypothetical protein
MLQKIGSSISRKFSLSSQVTELVSSFKSRDDEQRMKVREYQHRVKPPKATPENKSVTILLSVDFRFS